jgi:hypothetical protein
MATVNGYEAAARIAGLSSADMERWSQARNVSADEALEIWHRANGNADAAQIIWENDSDWADAVVGA